MLKNKEIYKIVFTSLISLFFLAFIFYMFYYKPHIYSLHTTEDYFVEYYTCIAFFFSSIISFIVFTKNIKNNKRYIYFLISAVSLFLAGEEISWGQRIFNFEVPVLVEKINTQNELTIHNIENIRQLDLQENISKLIIVWCFISLFTTIRKYNFIEKLKNIGIPFIPLYLLPFFLLASFLEINKTISREYSEFILSISILSYVIYLLIENIYKKKFNNLLDIYYFFAFLILICLICLFITFQFYNEKIESEMARRLNHMASNRYPHFELYDQSFQIYDYIYANPKFLMKDTVMNHTILLNKIGENIKAQSVIRQNIDLNNIENNYDLNHTPDLRKIGSFYKTLNKIKKSEYYFNKAIEIDKRNIEKVVDYDEQSSLLFSISQTYYIKGDLTNAIQFAEDAHKLVESANIRRKIYRKINSWKKEIRKRQ